MLSDSDAIAELSSFFAAQNDLKRLQESFSLVEFEYQEITLQEEMTELLQRWPLLQELVQG